MKSKFLTTCSVVLLLSCQKEQVTSITQTTQTSTTETQVIAPVQSLPVTAASFPREVIDICAGTIDFWARLTDYGGAITVGGREAHFFQVHDGSSTFHAGFNANDGVGNGGLVAQAGSYFACGTGAFGNWSYETIYGANNVNTWHHYTYMWNKNGIPCLQDPNKKVAIYIDGVLNTTSWNATGQQKFVPLTAGVFNLITTGNPPLTPGGEVAIDNLRIYDRKNKLTLWNTLGSEYEITHSNVGPNGSFNGGGNAHFVSGKNGNALSAIPVQGIGTL